MCIAFTRFAAAQHPCGPAPTCSSALPCSANSTNAVSCSRCGSTSRSCLHARCGAGCTAWGIRPACAASSTSCCRVRFAVHSAPLLGGCSRPAWAPCARRTQPCLALLFFRPVVACRYLLVYLLGRCCLATQSCFPCCCRLALRLCIALLTQHACRLPGAVAGDPVSVSTLGGSVTAGQGALHGENARVPQHSPAALARVLPSTCRSRC